MSKRILNLTVHRSSFLLFLFFDEQTLRGGRQISGKSEAGRGREAPQPDNLDSADDKRPGCWKPRIQSISFPLMITGQDLRSASVIFCNSSFTFFGALVWAGQNRSPGRQFLTVSSAPKRRGLRSWG